MHACLPNVSRWIGEKKYLIQWFKMKRHWSHVCIMIVLAVLRIRAFRSGRNTFTNRRKSYKWKFRIRETFGTQASLNISWNVFHLLMMWSYLGYMHGSSSWSIPNGHTTQKITWLWRQNYTVTSFWRHNDVIITSRVPWGWNGFRLETTGAKVSYYVFIYFQVILSWRNFSI